MFETFFDRHTQSDDDERIALIIEKYRHIHNELNQNVIENKNIDRSQTKMCEK